MFDLFKRKELARIKELEQTLERYRENDRNQHKEIKRLEQFELKYKILNQYVNDDEAILELLDCHNDKVKNENADKQHSALNDYMRQVAGLQANAAAMGGMNAGNPFYPLGSNNLLCNPFK